MPGIVGVISKANRDTANLQVRKMVAALCHESFYSTGTWTDENCRVSIGWTARKNSFCDRMPLRNETGDAVLVFSGEEYPEPDIARRLKAEGHQFGAEGPEYLVHLYERDASFPAGLNGRFHGMLADRNRGTAMLFNDRFGMHRLYYRETNDAFYFATEAKAILAVCAESRRIDQRSLGEFVSCGAVLENRTLFEGIRLLPPGSSWVFRNGTLEQKGNYFLPAEWEEQEELEPEAYYKELRAAFVGNLPRYYSGDERIGMSLTGGLDTRMILACRRPEPGSLPCYTFGSMFHENQDVRVARTVAEVCGQSHEVLTAGREFLSRFGHYAERAVYLTDGCVDVGRAPDLYLNELAREVAPARMTGLYGGEILRGVRAFKPGEPAAGLFQPELLTEILRTKETFAEIASRNPVSFTAFQQGPWYLTGSLALEQTQLTMRSPFLDNDFVRTVFRSPKAALADTAISWRLIADGYAALASIATDRGLLKGGGMASTARARALEFSFKAEYAYDSGMPQWLAKIDHAFAPLHLERMFLGRHKPFHFRLWYRDYLAGYVQEMLLDERALTRPYVERKGLEAVVRGHVNGSGNFTGEINKVLTLELLHRIFLDQPSATGRESQELEEQLSGSSAGYTRSL